MASLSSGKELISNNHVKVVVLDKLGSGGQGVVYKVNYDGKPMALKWYFTNKLKNPDEFKENLENNISKGSPSSSFLWPIDLVCDSEGGFGYIMDLRPDGYNQLSDFLLKKAQFSTVKSIINTAIDICSAFRTLHLRGFSYQDLNDGNFFINPQTGRVLICDNDNVAGDGINATGIMGKCRYMAPEVVLGQRPNKQSDKFSLAVVLFLLLFRGHPLEGKSTLVPCMTEAHEKKFYGENPIFIYDSEDNSNEPSRSVHRNVINTWHYYPQKLRDMFIRAFSKEVMKDPAKRIIEKEWTKFFIQLRDELVKCPYCNTEFFADSDYQEVTCKKCSKSWKRPGNIQCGKYCIPIFVGNRLYACHAEGLDREDVDCFKEIGEIILGKSKVEGKPAVVGLRNLSDTAWHKLGEKPETIEHNGVVRIVRNLELDLGGGYTAKII